MPFCDIKYYPKSAKLYFKLYIERNASRQKHVLSAVQ